MPYPLGAGSDDNVSKGKIGEGAWLWSVEPRAGVMSSEPSSSSDGTGAATRAGVEAPAPPGAATGAAPGAGEAATSEVWGCIARGPSWSGTGNLHEITTQLGAASEGMWRQ